MGWSIGFDTNWNRDIGYGVPAECDHPKCKKRINRGLSYVCGSDAYGGKYGCGLFFCEGHLAHKKPQGLDRAIRLCSRCYNNDTTKQFTAQNWKEHFRIELSGLIIRNWREGEATPRFYLPVYEPVWKDSMELWIFPLAPFVWLWRVLWDVFWIIWKDMISWQRMIRTWRKLK